MIINIIFPNGTIIKNARLFVRGSFHFAQQIETLEEFEKIMKGEVDTGFGNNIEFSSEYMTGMFDRTKVEYEIEK